MKPKHVKFTKTIEIEVEISAHVSPGYKETMEEPGEPPLAEDIEVMVNKENDDECQLDIAEHLPAIILDEIQEECIEEAGGE